MSCESGFARFQMRRDPDEYKLPQGLCSVEVRYTIRKREHKSTLKIPTFKLKGKQQWAEVRLKLLQA